MTNYIYDYCAIAALLVLSIILLKEELHHIQLNSYFNSRYFKWLRENFLPNFKLHIALLAVAIAFIFIENELFADTLKGFAIGVSIAASISILRKKVKKKLDYTKRAVRLFVTGILLITVINGIVFVFFNEKFAIASLLITSALSSVNILISNILIKPIELSINRWYINDAKKKISGYKNLIKIGVTGSYGKTSVKHFLHTILSEKYNTLMTPGSFNTTLGVVRTIREYLQPVHEVFIAEMGAKHIGDVQEICDIVEPEYGILTAIGPQHLESFGSLDNIKRAKLEVITNLPASGTGFVNIDNLAVSEIPSDVRAKIITFAVKKEADYTAANVAYRGRGMVFDVVKQGKVALTVETNLLGEHNVSNLLVCCAFALEIGVEKYRIEMAVKKIEAVEHRLQVKQTAAGITIIDDAFNSNPVGSKMALEALRRFEGNRKIVITPGMIELGDKEYELNREFGKYIAENCDIAVLVGKNRTAPIQEGIRAAGFPEEKMLVCRDLNEANERVKGFILAGDVVLYENDLPDTFNE